MTIKYFGEIADVTNKTNELVVLKELTLSELKTFLSTNYKLNLEDIHIAINHTIISKDEERTLSLTDEIAILSPFAGG